MSNNIFTLSRFASQTLRRKILDDYRELPHQEARINLRNKLIEFILQQTNPAVTTQLSLALADLSLQMPQEKEAVKLNMPAYNPIYPSRFENFSFFLEILQNFNCRGGCLLQIRFLNLC